MFALPGLVLLLLTDTFKPQEYVPQLAGLPLLYVFTGLTLLGFALDLRLGLSRLAAAPQLGLALLFVGWCLLTNLQNGAGEVATKTFNLLIPFSLFLLVAHVVQTFRALQWVAAAVLATGLFLAFIGTHQGFAPWGCYQLAYGQGTSHLTYDGRPCNKEDQRVCEREGAEPGAEYMCEHVGLLGTQSIHGRVRFRGTIEDPNELAMAVSIAMPFAFAFFERRRSFARLALLLMAVALAGACAVFTRSRGGQLVFLVVLGVYFVRRFGLRGLSVGVACALPIFLLGGRDPAEAASSTLERLDCWSVGLQLLRSSPLLGVGLGQFVEHHYQTAHNSFVLTAAELGFPGMVLWSAVVYLALKIPLQVLRGSEPGGTKAIAPVAHSWSLALLAALAGLVVGMVFLSYAYKEVLWIFLGLSGALYQAVARHRPSFRVRFGIGDLALVGATDSLLIVAVKAYTRIKLGH